MPRPAIAPGTLKEALDRGEDLVLLDVREPDEFADWRIPGATNMPLARLPEEASKLPRGVPIVTICAHGIRSGKASAFLANAGFDARNLAGGMVAWNAVVDESEVEAGSGLAVLQIDRVGKGCLSHLVVAGGEAVVVDPTFETGPFVAAARRRGARIVAAVDTHAHADHASGGRRLAAETGCRYLAPDEVAPAAHEPLRPGDSVRVGTDALRAVATPGHTPGSLTLLLRDLAFTGDTLFVEGVGRPDLGQDPAPAASALHDSLTRVIGSLPNATRVLPAHRGGGVAKRSARATVADLGGLRASLPALRLDRDAFVEWAVEGLGARPSNYERLKAINRGLEDLDDPEEIRELEAGPNRCAIGAK